MIAAIKDALAMNRNYKVLVSFEAEIFEHRLDAIVIGDAKGSINCNVMYVLMAYNRMAYA